MDDKSVGELWKEAIRDSKLPIVFQLRQDMLDLIGKLVEERTGRYTERNCSHKPTLHVEQACREYDIPYPEVAEWKARQG